jgi:CO/xanthine dehydrogenase FAD-binding subunit
LFDVTVKRPESIEEIRNLTAQTPLPRKFLAGGTDLCVNARHGQDTGTWIDLSCIQELKGVIETPEYLIIGSMETITSLKENNLVQKWAPALWQACSKFASVTIRNMATIGGNCANASPAADGLTALYAEDSTVIVNNNGIERHIPVDSLCTGVKKTMLVQDDLIRAFRIPKRSHKGVFMKIGARESLAISKVCMAMTGIINEGRVSNLRISLGAVGQTILRALKTERFLENHMPDEETIREAQNLITGECAPINDQRSTADYRRAMTAVLLGRCLSELRLS